MTVLSTKYIFGAMQSFFINKDEPPNFLNISASNPIFIVESVLLLFNKVVILVFYNSQTCFVFKNILLSNLQLSEAYERLVTCHIIPLCVEHTFFVFVLLKSSFSQYNVPLGNQTFTETALPCLEFLKISKFWPQL